MNLIKGEEDKLDWKFNLSSVRELVDRGRIREVSFDPAFPCHKPCVFIYGQNSDFVRPSDHPAIRQLFPCSTFYCIEGAGHYLHVERQAEFLSILNSQLDVVDVENKVM